MEKRRKNIRLSEQAYEIPVQIFSITICTIDRRPLFQNEVWSKTILSSLETGPFGENTERYAFCLMPDHLHLLLAPKKGNLIDLIHGWKGFTANLLRRNGLSDPCWQRGFYDHALRKEEEIQKVAEYIVNNPVRAGIVDDWTNYPFSWHRWM
ncbi:MAG: hypothetical protein A2170_16680 [Deltaproteobacteria bacterium RBG_13_53_10]|nr:MAG: hypothetical protein A2170_16680 [Deltaproteobacteria bacterium RBG_13_53_10]